MNRAGGGPVIRLAVAPGAVATGGAAEIDRQAYRLRLDDRAIEVSGNADQGLFYGVQTLLQLVKRDAAGRLTLPTGTIEDWPALEWRFLHWDTKHHQDRMETLKRYLDWSARMKINRIGFELEDKFAYPSHPAIGAPGAFTPAELQEIVNYGLQRYIQVVPVIQAPAHFGYVLKHPEFASLRADGNNYQAAMCDPRTNDLIFSMYDDAIAATQGVDSGLGRVSAAGRAREPAPARDCRRGGGRSGLPEGREGARHSPACLRVHARRASTCFRDAASWSPPSRTS